MQWLCSLYYIYQLSKEREGKIWRPCTVQSIFFLQLKVKGFAIYHRIYDLISDLFLKHISGPLFWVQLSICKEVRDELCRPYIRLKSSQWYPWTTSLGRIMSNFWGRFFMFSRVFALKSCIIFFFILFFKRCFGSKCTQMSSINIPSKVFTYIPK